MALLKYQCKDCQEIFEVLTQIQQEAVCPKCQSNNVERYYQGKCFFGMKGSPAGYTSTTTEDTEDWKSF